MTPAQFTGQDDVDTALAAPLFVVFKHSQICPTSARAFSEWKRFASAHPDVPTRWIDVIAQRPLSRHVEAATGVRHESPQALVVRDGAVVWHGSHFDVTVSALEHAVSGT